MKKHVYIVPIEREKEEATCSEALATGYKFYRKIILFQGYKRLISELEVTIVLLLLFFFKF